jgi:hypothetical protein
MRNETESYPHLSEKQLKGLTIARKHLAEKGYLLATDLLPPLSARGGFIAIEKPSLLRPHLYWVGAGWKNLLLLRYFESKTIAREMVNWLNGCSGIDRSVRLGRLLPGGADAWRGLVAPTQLEELELLLIPEETE